MYEDKKDWYYAFVRKDIMPLLPENSGRVLEIGCGGGGTLAWLKEAGRANWVAGIELSAEAAAIARPRVDALYEGDVDQHLSQFEPGSLDLILCLDVLEHLVDPWVTLKQLKILLQPGGHIIVSLPNIRHYSVLLPLLFSGRWKYSDAGIMDRTHLRFFSHDTAIELLQNAGLKAIAEKSTYSWGTWDHWKDLLTLRLLNEFWSFQFLICAEKCAPQQVAVPAEIGLAQ